MADDFLSHLDERGKAHMVDVGDKQTTSRTAIASGHVQMAPATLALLADNALPKGDVLATARIAGIQAAKRTSELIPLCHLLALSSVTLDFEQDSELPGIVIRARCRVEGRTGVEMEALTAVSVAALTLYDMCKAVDKAMVIGAVQLDHKVGGKSGEWQRESLHTATQTLSAPPADAKSIKVLLFAALRETLATEQLHIPFDELEDATLNGLKEALIARDERFTLLRDQQVLSAVNQKMCRTNAALAPGDEIGFFPPVTGG